MDKKKLKDTVTGIIVVAVFITMVILVYNHGKNQVRRELANRINELSPRGGPPETIEGLRTAIALYEAQIELNVKEGAQTGVYWKILAIRLADRGMHRDALDAIEKAIYYNSSDPTLFFLAGQYARTSAHAALNFSANSSGERERLLDLAESAYLRAIQLDPLYPRPRLGLGELYFETERPADAVPQLERFLEMFPNNIRGMDVLAQSLFLTGNSNRAVEMYDRIISSKSSTPGEKAQAKSVKEFIQDFYD